jgi:glycerol-3-phosphate acyltransferase PlsY
MFLLLLDLPWLCLFLLRVLGKPYAASHLMLNAMALRMPVNCCYFCQKPAYELSGFSSLDVVQYIGHYFPFYAFK